MKKLAHVVFIVPIRDWNPASNTNLDFLRYTSFYRPYKGLKLIYIIISVVFSFRVFIVPIRDWNIKYFEEKRQYLASFYRPYKGLKQKFKISALYVFSAFLSSL